MQLLASTSRSRCDLYVCGPEPMLRAVASLALRATASTCELALEAHMACGFGVCLGCVVPTHGPDGKGFDVRARLHGRSGHARRAIGLVTERLRW